MPLPQVSRNIPSIKIFRINNKSYPDDIALMYFGKKISYGRLFAEVEKTEKAFIACGVKGGDNVALCVPATPEAIYAILALNKIGANANMLNPTFTPEQLADRINDTKAKLLIVVNELYSRLENVLPNTDIKTVISFPTVNSLRIIVKLIINSAIKISQIAELIV